jgi:dolichol-phosphate mannosyltransferase
MNLSKVSIILPTYNEAGHIVELISKIISNIPLNWAYEVVVVDDNSPDGTYDVVRNAFCDNVSVVPISRTTDRGLAKSIRRGIEKATGDYVIVMDSDFTHDPKEIPRMLHVGAIYDIISGSRFCPGGSMQDTRHYIASLIYNWFIRLVVRTQIQDNLGGFFLIRKTMLSQLPYDEIFFGYGDYYFRLLHYAQGAGMSVVEIPARYNLRLTGASKSSFLRMFLSYTVAGIRLRCRARKHGHLSTHLKG